MNSLEENYINNNIENNIDNNIENNIDNNIENEVNLNKEPTYSIEYLSRLSKKIEKLNKIHHVEIGKILFDNNIKLSENNNGIFVKLNNISENIINKISDYIDFINNQESHINIDEIKKNKLENSFFKDIKD